MSWYCDVAQGHSVHGPYHDREHGFPTDDERVLFERFALEIFQAGLSWLLVLRKRAALRRGFDGFAVDKVAQYDDGEVSRLLGDVTIIRNRAKIRAIIENAKRIQMLRASHDGFAGWLAAHHPRSEVRWLQLFRITFRFAGPGVVREFLMSIGYLPGAHRLDCPVYGLVAAAAPPWLSGSSVARQTARNRG